jgi:hypothetical protein
MWKLTKFHRYLPKAALVSQSLLMTLVICAMVLTLHIWPQPISEMESDQKKARCVLWYVEFNSIVTIQRIFLRTYLTTEDCNLEQIRHNHPHRKNSQRTLKKKNKNHGDIPKKTRKNKLKTNSIIVNSFYNYSITANAGRRTTYNAGQHKNIEFYIQRQDNFKFNV